MQSLAIIRTFNTNTMFALIVLICSLVATNAFVFRSSQLSSYSVKSNSAMNALAPDSVDKLEDMLKRYDMIKNVDSEEANAESAKLKEAAEKYETYKEVKKLMIKIKSMYSGEVSELRKSKQEQSFIDLYKGKLQLEEILQKHLGVPVSAVMPIGLEEVEKLTAEIATLESSLSTAEIVLPKGQRTRDERFAN